MTQYKNNGSSKNNDTVAKIMTQYKKHWSFGTEKININGRLKSQNACVDQDYFSNNTLSS